MRRRVPRITLPMLSCRTPRGHRLIAVVTDQNSGVHGKSTRAACGTSHPGIAIGSAPARSAACPVSTARYDLVREGRIGLEDASSSADSRTNLEAKIDFGRAGNSQRSILLSNSRLQTSHPDL